jgi:hypothetical protein
MGWIDSGSFSREKTLEQVNANGRLFWADTLCLHVTFSIHLKPNSLSEFTRIFANEVLPFQHEITFSTAPNGLDMIAISLWDTKEHAEAYNATGYPEVLKSLNKVLDGAPKVRVANVISSTLQNTVAIAA